MISAIALLFLFGGSALGHHPQAIGQDCSEFRDERVAGCLCNILTFDGILDYSRDCHPYIDGGPAGYDNIVTCAIHQD